MASRSLPSGDAKSAATKSAPAAAFTPGPWHLFRSSYAAARGAVEVNDPSGLTVAYTVNFVVEFSPKSDANARLIAAAPELLAALQGSIGALEFSQDFHRDLGNEEQAFVADKLDAALKAIAKATGQ
ncbi:MAG: hypothetical protein WA154_11520 [Moraxellaceae bacterium]